MTAETVAVHDLIALAAETLHPCGEPGAGPRLRDEHDRNRDGLGDHRRCRTGSCTIAARWHDPVREAGGHRRGGSRAAVGGRVDPRRRGRGRRHHRHAEAGQDPVHRRLGRHPEGKGLVYVVRRFDSALL